MRGRSVEVLLTVILAILFSGCFRDSGNKILLDPNADEWSDQAPDEFIAQFETTKGTFEVLVTRKWAPNGADRFFNLIRHGYFSNARFHRVVRDFIVQFGLAGEPNVTQTWMERYIPDDPVVGSNTRGTIAFAFTKPGTRSTQLFINLINNTRLDSLGFAPLGKVIVGMGIVDQLYDGYGENSGGGLRRGDQSMIISRGNAYLDSEFPKLDRLRAARIKK